MGFLTYDSTSVSFEDRLLTHLQIVIVQKFRRGEAFVMSWLDALSVGDGRSSVWMSPTVPAYFKFSGSRVPQISQEWLELLGQSANSSSGLIVMGEDGRPARAEGGDRYR